MRRRLLAALGACGLVVGGLVAAPSSPAELVAQLGADDFADREAAEKALADLGPAALPALRTAIKSDDPEVRRRAVVLLADIERTAESAARIVPKTVRLAYRDVPLGTAVNDLKARTGVNLALDPAGVADAMRKVTCETAELPAWEAVEALCKAAGVREVFRAELDVPKPERRGRGYYTPPPPPPTPEAVPVLLADGRHVSLPGSRSAAIRVLALPPSYPGHRVFLGTGDFVLNFDVTPTAGLNWLDTTCVKLTRVIDDAGRLGCAGTLRDSAPDIDPFGGMVFGGGRVMRWDFEGNPIAPGWHPNPRAVPVAVKLRTPDARSLRLIEGVVVGEVTVPNRELIVAHDPAKLSGVTLSGPDGLKLSVTESRTAADGAVTLGVAVESPAAWVMARRRGGGFAAIGFAVFEPLRPGGEGNQVRSFDAKGKLLNPSVGQTSMSDDGVNTRITYTMTYRAAAGVPAKLVVVGPQRVAVEVPFRMENVPLP